MYGYIDGIFYNDMYIVSIFFGKISLNINKILLLINMGSHSFRLDITKLIGTTTSYKVHYVRPTIQCFHQQTLYSSYMCH